MKTRIILLRHGKSEASDQGIVQGQGLSIPLTDEGRRQAKETAEKLAHVSFDNIFSSTAIRATETAQIVRTHHADVPFTQIAELNERSKGAGEGMTHEEYAQRYPDIMRQWEQGLDARPEGGESFEDVHQRVVPVIERHMSEIAPGSTALYVIHGNVIRVLLGHMLHIPHELRARIKQDYCAVNSVVFDHEKKRWDIEYVNRVFYD